MLKALMGKGNNMQHQTSNFSRQMKTTKEVQIEMLEIKNTVTELKDTIEWFISRFDTVKERISKPEHSSI